MAMPAARVSPFSVSFYNSITNHPVINLRVLHGLILGLRLDMQQIRHRHLILKKRLQPHHPRFRVSQLDQYNPLDHPDYGESISAGCIVYLSSQKA